MRLLPAALVLALALAACGGDSDDAGPSNPSTTPSTPAEWLARAQGAIDSATGYRVEMTGHNMVLPQWGGIDAATLDIGRGGETATGTLERTGDGTYAVVFRDDQTYFKRSTCDHYARIPGGGPDVLKPFLWARTGALEAARDAQFGPAYEFGPVMEVALADLGRVRIELDEATSLPRRMAQTADAAGGGEFAFSRWDQTPTVPPAPAGAPDQGPGGNPC